jgi:hypothetical protein
MYLGVGVVSVAARPSSHRLNVSGREDPCFQREIQLAYSTASTRPPSARLYHLSPLVSTLQGDSEHAWARLGPTSGRRELAAHPGQVSPHTLHHCPLVSVLSTDGQRPRAHRPSGAQLFESGWDDGVHDLSGRGGYEDVEGMECSAEAPQEGEHVQQVHYQMRGVFCVVL